MRRCAVLALIAGCNSFEDPDLVIDLRVLAMAASVPEQVIDVDLAQPPQPTELLAQLVPSEMCALVADPGEPRALRYALTLCVEGADDRCATEGPALPLASGVLDDPDVTVPAPPLCATIQPDGNLLGILLETLERDALAGLGGLDYIVQLTVGGAQDDPALDQYASKTLRVAPRIPAEREANTNPWLERIDALIDGEPAPLALPLGRCVDQAAPLVVRPGTEVRLTPIEPMGVREVYVAPTLDGKSLTLVESLTYQWRATAGTIGAGMTGGPRDVAGNLPELFTHWRAPRRTADEGPLDVELWIVQRDERLGAAWYQSCVRVVP